MVSGLKAATTIPIVATIDDPVAAGLVSSLARPGTNLTGVTVDTGLELYGKRLALLVEVRPNASIVGYLSSSENWRRPTGAAVREAALQAKIGLTHVDLGDAFNEATYSAAFRSIESAHIDALLVSDEPDHNANTKTLTTLATNARIPTMLLYRFARCVSIRGRSGRRNTGRSKPRRHSFLSTDQVSAHHQHKGGPTNWA
jgi:putative ABC transport system substrate-binding protein